MKTRSTQYRLQDVPQVKKQVASPIKVKISKPKTKMKSVGTDTHDPFPTFEVFLESDNDKEIEQEETVGVNRENLDESFHLTDENAAEQEEPNLTADDKPLLRDEKLIVSLSSLKPLLVFCNKCHKRAHITDMQRRGTLMTVSLLCEDNHDTKWCSQPKMQQGMASGNISMAASILLYLRKHIPSCERDDGGRKYRFHWYHYLLRLAKAIHFPCN